jgi:hypothetical protein
VALTAVFALLGGQQGQDHVAIPWADYDDTSLYNEQQNDRKRVKIWAGCHPALHAALDAGLPSASSTWCRCAFSRGPTDGDASRTLFRRPRARRYGRLGSSRLSGTVGMTPQQAGQLMAAQSRKYCCHCSVT